MKYNNNNLLTLISLSPLFSHKYHVLSSPLSNKVRNAPPVMSHIPHPLHSKILVEWNIIITPAPILCKGPTNTSIITPLNRAITHYLNKRINQLEICLPPLHTPTYIKDLQPYQFFINRNSSTITVSPAHTSFGAQ